jgi:outer membrane protein OmpA-like peptidoglycan-associated protein
VNRREAVLLTLSGGAFIFDSSRLTAEAKDLLKKAARVIRAHPQEKVIVEGHTDGIGTASRFHVAGGQALPA